MAQVIRGAFTYLGPYPVGDKEVYNVYRNGEYEKVKTVSSFEEFEAWVSSLNNQPRNILTHQDDTLLAMAEVEEASMGDSYWLERELRVFEEGPRPSVVDNSFASARKQLIEARKSYMRQIQEAKDSGCLDEIWRPQGWLDRPEDWALQSSVHTIYGSGGFNRWIVRNNGDVVLSGYNSKSAIPIAEMLGFEVS